MSRYTNATTDGRQGRALDVTAEALRVVMGWDGIVLSASYTVDEGSAVSAYATEADRDADQDGASAPRITRALAIVV